MTKFILLMFVMFTSHMTTLAQEKNNDAPVDSTLLKELEKELAPQNTEPQPAAQPRSAVSTNPNLSVIGDFGSAYHSLTPRHFDFSFNESEITLQSTVDPYAKADFFLSFAKDPTTGRFEATIEEAYLTTLDLPEHLQLKAGKFRMALGRLNPVHPHALPFIDMPNVYVNFFGDEGLNDEGFSLSWLVPNPFDFYQELTLEVTEGPSGNPSFTRSGTDKYLYLAHLKNFFDLTDNSTLELGLTGIVGPNGLAYSSTVGALDITYKWKPLQFNTYRSLVWQTEAFLSSAQYTPTDKINSWGMYSFITYQIAQRFFLTGRFDYSNFPYSSSLVERAYSASLGWYATEFQKIELEAKTTTSNFQQQFQQAMLRWIFVIGSHGAHAY